MVPSRSVANYRVDQVTEGVLVSQEERARTEPRRSNHPPGRVWITSSTAPALWSSTIGVAVILLGPVVGAQGWIVGAVGSTAALTGVAALAWASYLGLSGRIPSRRRADRVDDHDGW